MESLADYEWLTGGEARPWLDQLAESQQSPLRQLDALRRGLPADRARLVVEQVELKRRAAEKFGDAARRMFFTRVMLEQATDRWIAHYKAARLASFGAREFGDYCCGIGGDLCGLAQRGPATGWDASEIACRLAAVNCDGAAKVRCDDVANCTPGAQEAWHLDPDRRASGRRTTAVSDYSPGPELVDRWLSVNAGGAVKLAPASDAPVAWQRDGECEWITHDRECRQQVVWFGPLTTAAGKRRATIVRRDESSASIVGDANLPCVPTDEPAAFLYDPDPSALAAGLLGSMAAMHGWRSLGVGGAYLTGDGRANQPLATGFAVLDCMPLRIPTLAKYFAKRGVGKLEIYKRGIGMAPEEFRKRLKLRGDNSAAVVLTRIGRREVAIVVERLSP